MYTGSRLRGRAPVDQGPHLGRVGGRGAAGDSPPHCRITSPSSGLDVFWETYGEDLAALCLTGDTASGDPLLGAKSTLGSVAAVVLGGTALSGGRGSAVGSIFGAIILGLVGSVVFFAGVPFEYQNLVQGLIVLAALAGGVFAARRS